MNKYRAEFLWKSEDDSIEAAGYEFANGCSEEYQKLWWGILLEKIRQEKPSRESVDNEN